ncbi:MAG: homoserine dehydrogenase [Chitinivibrionales bacterium]|nr:homoserine dehydrogenase [Chitinivibrionales bacterium]MBD3395906.1 homoserine dehydrogenase [Chitinivibrionales bacterium]
MAGYNIGIVGLGTIGRGVVKILARQQSFFTDTLGLPVTLKRVADIDESRFESVPVGDAARSTTADPILKDPDIHIVVELIGGTTAAREIVLGALRVGKHVVTANKALIAEHGPEIFAAAEQNGVSVYFEAAVGGGMPAIKTIREAMIGNDITSVKTIINGTCNYVLTHMETRGLPFDAALRQAQEAGFAEADPALDIGGGDTGHKVAIMASLLSGGYVPYGDIPIEGITAVSAEDIAFARDLGYRVKLLGIIKATDSAHTLDVRVHPAMLHLDHILASVSHEYNAVLLEGDAVGQILLYGKGAGELPTASAIISDVIDVARNIAGSTPVRIPMGFYSAGGIMKTRPVAEVVSRYYLRFTVVDRPKVLAPIAATLGDHGISIASVLQKEGSLKDRVPVIILTHAAREAGLRAAITAIENTDFVRDKTQVIRIEE